MWLKTKINDFRRWFKLSTETQSERLTFAVTAMFYFIMLVFVVLLIIVLWPLFVLLVALFIAVAIVTSPIWIWIIKGQKR